MESFSLMIMGVEVIMLLASNFYSSRVDLQELYIRNPELCVFDCC